VTSSILTRDKIFQANDWDFDEFAVPKWAGTLRIRALSAGERLRLAQEAGGEELDGEKAFRFFARIICLSVVDADGKPLFDLERDYEPLLSRDWGTLQMVAGRIMQFNGMASEDVKELEKN
jgi:hypothetical protein